MPENEPTETEIVLRHPVTKGRWLLPVPVGQTPESVLEPWAEAGWVLDKRTHPEDVPTPVNPVPTQTDETK